MSKKLQEVNATTNFILVGDNHQNNCRRRQIILLKLNPIIYLFFDTVSYMSESIVHRDGLELIQNLPTT